jgi:ribosome recycling factor
MKTMCQLLLLLLSSFNAGDAFVNKRFSSHLLVTGGVVLRRANNFRSVLTMNEWVDEVTTDSSDRMSKSVESVVSNLSTLRAGRPSAALLDRVMVDYFEVETPLIQLASVSVQSGMSLVVSPYDKSAIGDIERAIMESDVGMMPNNDGEKIRLNVPQLTEDRRKELVKDAKRLREDGKIAIRNIRRDAIDTLKKLGKDKDLGISEDNEKDATTKIQDIHDKYVKQVDEVVAKKEKDILTV